MICLTKAETDMDQCIFCSIVQGKVTGYIVAESKYCIAILDNQPLHQGHVLIITRQHYSSVVEVPLEIFQDATTLAHQVVEAVDAEFHPPRVGMLVAGFDVAHFHIHVVALHDRSDIATRRITEDNFVVATEDMLVDVSAKLLARFKSQ